MEVSKSLGVKKTISNLRNSNAFYLILLFVVLTIALHKIVLLINPLKWDAIDCFLPWRYHIGECLQNGNFPFWNPYQELGYPIYADPSSGAWYPPVWFFGYVFGYSPYVISIEYFMHVFLGGVGFFYLVSFFNVRKEFTFIGALSYALCGVFISNSQHFPYVISACWLPYVMLFYFKMISTNKKKYAVLAGVFLSLMITGGYPAFTIILSYFLIVYSVVFFVKRIKEWKPIVLNNLIFAFVALLLSIGLLISVFQVAPYLTRLADFEIAEAQFSPFSPQSFMSFVFPYSSTVDTPFFDSDVSMRNGFFGFFTLIFFIVGFFKKKELGLKIIFYFGIFCLLASVGKYLPIRKFLFDYVPLMDLFRFPSVFRLFFIIAAILVSVKQMGVFFAKDNFNKKKLYYFFGGAFIVLVAFVLIARYNEYLNLLEYSKTLFKFQAQQTILQNSVVQSIFYLIILFFALVGVFLLNRKKIEVLLMILIGVNLIITTKLVSPTVTASTEITSKKVMEGIVGLPQGFGELPNNVLKQGEEKPPGGFIFWRNFNTLTKKIGVEGFNSFTLKAYEVFKDDYTQIFEKTKENRFIELGGDFHTIDSIEFYNNEPLAHARQFFIENEDLLTLKKAKVSLTKDSNSSIVISKYSPKEYEINCNTHQKTTLTLHQKHFPYWKAYINDKPTEIIKTNLSVMTVVIPKGTNKVSFKFENSIVSNVFLFLLTFYCIAIVTTAVLWLRFLTLKVNHRANKNN